MSDNINEPQNGSTWMSDLSNTEKSRVHYGTLIGDNGGNITPEQMTAKIQEIRTKHAAIVENIVAAYERCPTSGAPHWHISIMLRASHRRYPSFFNGLFGVMYGTFKSVKPSSWVFVLNYVLKKYTKICAPIIAGELPETIGGHNGAKIYDLDRDSMQYVERAKKAKESEIMLEIIELLDGGATAADVRTAYPGFFFRNSKKVQDYISSLNTCENEANLDIKVFVIFGESGSGKTKWANAFPTSEFNTSGNDKAYWIIPTNDGKQWFDNYNNESTIIIDDFDGSVSKVPMQTLLTLLDIYARNIQWEIKGGKVALKHSNIIITSNSNPKEWYANEPREKVNALLRRLTYVAQMKKPNIGEPIVMVDQRREYEADEIVYLEAPQMELPCVPSGNVPTLPLPSIPEECEEPVEYIDLCSDVPETPVKKRKLVCPPLERNKRTQPIYDASEFRRVDEQPQNFDPLEPLPLSPGHDEVYAMLKEFIQETDENWPDDEIPSLLIPMEITDYFKGEYDYEIKHPGTYDILYELLRNLEERKNKGVHSIWDTLSLQYNLLNTSKNFDVHAVDEVISMEIRGVAGELIDAVKEQLDLDSLDKDLNRE